MKRFSLFLYAAVCAGGVCAAQDNAARSASAREDAEERYKLLNSAVDSLTTGQADLQRRISALADEVRSVRAEETKTDTSKFVTREDFNRLAKAIDEIEQKRESDKKLIRDEFEQLKKEIVRLLNAPATTTAPAAPRKSKGPASAEKAADRATEKTNDKSNDKPDSAGPTQEGVWYVIRSHNTLIAVVDAHNEEFKKKSRKTSIKLVQDANPGLKPTNMKVGQKIWIPLVPL